MRYLFLSLIVLLFAGNVHAQSIGYSGMEKIGKSKYLVVMDNKNLQDGERLAIVSINEKDGISVKKLKVKDWKHKLGRGNDLESVCAIPSTKNEYLLVEAGYWEGEFGRIFRVRLKDEKIKVLDIFQIPSLSPGGKNNPTGDNFEGVACLKNNDDLYIVLGERGGTTRFPNGLLRVGILKEKAKKIDWKTYSDYTFEAKLPKSVKPAQMMRTITDLHLTKEGKLFASAAVDDSDLGPFKSVVYQVATVGFKKGKLKFTKSKNKQVYKVEGFKIEALSASPDFMINSQLSIGTEDEIFPGQWRPLWKK